VLGSHNPVINWSGAPLHKSDMPLVPVEWSGALKRLFKKHAPLCGGSLGLIRGVEHRICLNPGVVPMRQYHYKDGTFSQEREKAEVERIRSMGVIKPPTGKWASPVVIVPKPDGSVRFCSDYRNLSLVNVEDADPIPKMDECIDSLEDARVFSTLD